MDQSLIKPRIYTDTFDGGEYGMDLDENIGYRTPFLDADAENAKAMFETISDSYRASTLEAVK